MKFEVTITTEETHIVDVDLEDCGFTEEEAEQYAIDSAWDSRGLDDMGEWEIVDVRKIEEV